MKKKILLGLTLGLASLVSKAQDKPFFEKVDFVGAMGTDDWSKPWANYRPDQVDYPTTTVNITSDITSDTKWTADKVYYLSQFTYVKNGATLTIEPGTIIRGSKAGNTLSSAAGALIITRGSKIYAKGTPDKPIVFTSNQPVGQRSVGDWAGVMLFGKATQNVPTQVSNGYKETNFEVFPASNLDIWYGGNDDQDSSGLMTYVRIEFGGWYAEVDKEINGLTLGGVGNKTVLNNIQVSFTNDDSYEWFGGTVNAKHLIAYCGVDDDFDTDGGFRGKLQFCVGQRHPLYWDFSGSSGAASRGFESDDNTNNTTVAGNGNPMPITAPIFSNVTLIGPIPSGFTAASLKSGNKFRQGQVIRTNSSLSCFNSIVMGYPTGFALNHSDNTNPVSTYSKAVQDSISIRNSYISNCDTKIGPVNNYPTALTPVFNPQKWWGTPSFKNDSTILLADNIGLENPKPFFNNGDPADVNYGMFTSIPDYRLKSTSILLTAASFTHPKIANTIVTGMFESSILDASQIVLFPNPATEKVEIALSKDYTDATVNVYNATGLVVASAKAFGESVKFDVSNFANGLYIVSVTNGGKAVSKTLVINR